MTAMTILSGTRLGPYEILSPIGAGGMGEVYRARDTKLNRDVAIKVLPSELSSDAHRLARFEKEARTASALNHPNIVTIYEIGRVDSTSFMAMELVEGKTLRELLVGGAMPLKKILALASQIADGLAKAHGAGIVHRDLKPENLMVSRDGFVKILDFGLAKLVPVGFEGSRGTELPTMTRGTEAGTVLGTVGYMSPEQASGAPVDFRSDQFSFGSILYEMTTEKRAFARPTAAQTLAAIIQEEPQAIAALNPDAPPPLQWIIERCLAKEPEQRYASTRDLARDLTTLRDRLSNASISGLALAIPAPRRRGVRLLAMTAVVAAALAIGFAAHDWLRRDSQKTQEVSFRRLTFRRGNLLRARFAPDGRTVVYSAAWEGRPAEIFTVRTDGTQSRALGIPKADVLAVSSKGELAIQLKTESLFLPGGAGTLARVPLGGGAPREVLENVFAADWSPNGEELAVIRLLETGGNVRLEFPIGHTLVEGLYSIRIQPGPSAFSSSRRSSFHMPRVSPDGRLVAFRDWDKGVIAIVDRAGKRRDLSAWKGNFSSVSWSPSGKEILFVAGHSAEDAALRAVDLSGRERILLHGAGNLIVHDMSPDGRFLLERSSAHGGILCLPPGESREGQLEWLDQSFLADLSEDGSTILFRDRSESEGSKRAAYLRRTDGSPPIRLGEGTPMSLSPDGKWALLLTDGTPRELVLQPTGSGIAKKVPIEGIKDLQGARFLPDGKRIAVFHFTTEKRLLISIVDLEGGKPQTVETKDDARQGVSFSPDGTLLAYATTEHKVDVVPIAGGSPRAVPGAGLEPNEQLIQWSADGRFLFICDTGNIPARVSRLSIETGERTVWKELQPADVSGTLAISNIVISRDGRSYAYNYWGTTSSDLYVVEGLK